MAIHIFGTEYHIPGEVYFKTTIGRLLRGFRGFGRDANILVVISLIGSVGSGLFGLTMSLYLQALHFSYADIGLIMSLGTITVLVLLLPAGILSHRLGTKPLIIIGSICGAISVVLFLFTKNFWIFALSNMLGGVNQAFSGPALNALLAEKCSEKRRKYLFTLNSFAGTLGSAFGMLFGGMLPNIYNKTGYSDTLLWFKIIFIISLILSFVKIIGYLFVKEKRENKTCGKYKYIPRSWNVIKYFAVTSALIGFGAGLVVPWFQIYFKTKFNASYSDIGYVFALQQFLMTALILIMPLIAERTGSVKAIVITQGIAIFVLVAIPNTPIFSIAVIAFIARAILMNIAGPIQGALMMNVVNEEDRTSASAINQLFWTAFWAIGTFAAGYIMEWNIDAPFFITAAFYTVGVVAFYFFFRNVKEEKND